MAIIRIKRTTGSNLPTGLTFGELAFIGATGGATASRLYIAGPQGVCVWIGAEILNSPTFWQGVTAETTVPTVQAVRDFVVGFGGGTFTSDVTLNLSGSKSFGKYTNGQVLPAAGRTPIQVILDALVESIVPGVTVRGLSGFGDPTITYGTIPFGATAVRIGITWGYQINTPGATAQGATLEFKRGAGAFSTISGSYWDTVAPFWTQSSGGYTLNSYLHSFTQTQYDTSAITYRYSVHDSGGAGLSYSEFTITPSAYITPTNTITPSAYFTNGGSDTATNRERGNTGTTLSGTITSSNNTNFINITAYLVQYQINGGNWYNQLNNVLNDATYTTLATPAGATTVSLAVKPTVSPIDSMAFRVYVKDTFNTSGVLSTTPSTVQFYKRLFYGATSDIPTTAAQVRQLPSFTKLSNNGTSHQTGQFTFATGTVYNKFVIALPVGLTLNGPAYAGAGTQGVKNLTTPETLFGNSDPGLDKFVLSTGITLADDFSGTDINYNIYTYTADTPYSGGSQDFQVNYGGSLINTT
jgi:hypothetical protein